MFHVLGMALALVAANAARLGASLNDRFRNRWLELDFARKHIASRRTYVRAIEVEANAPDKRLDVLFA
jgi:hypothetical protein